MLNLRSALVLTAAGLCLWGLFSLLSSLREPGLLRSQKATVVKGCEVIEDEDTRRICTPLFCQKALIDAKLAAWDARFAVQQQRASASNSDFTLITGTAADASHSSPQMFGCLLEGSSVRAAKVMTAMQAGEFEQTADESPEEIATL